MTPTSCIACLVLCVPVACLCVSVCPFSCVCMRSLRFALRAGSTWHILTLYRVWYVVARLRPPHAFLPKSVPGINLINTHICRFVLLVNMSRYTSARTIVCELEHHYRRVGFELYCTSTRCSDKNTCEVRIYSLLRSYTFRRYARIHVCVHTGPVHNRTWYTYGDCTRWKKSSHS